MDTLQNPPGAPASVAGVASASAQPAAPRVLASTGHIKGCKCSSCEELRAKWRAKHDLAKARKTGGEISAPLPTTESASSENAPPVQALAPVPYEPSLFKPLVEILVKGAEQGTKAALVSKAKQISSEIAAQVEKDAEWNPVSKGVLLESGPHVAAKWAARVGLPADSATDLAFLAAASQIGLGFVASLNRLNESLAKLEEAKGRKPEQK